MHDDSSEESQSYYEDDDERLYVNYPCPNSHRQFRTPLQKIISLNVAIFNDFGISVSAGNFRCETDEEDEAGEMQEEDNSSDNGQIDYGDDNEDNAGDPMEQDSYYYNQQEEEDRQHSLDILSFEQSFQMRAQHSWEESNNQSPFFIGAQRPQGLTKEEIENLPTMRWSVAHNIFNKGEKCSICLQDFQLGHVLRVMQCLHRYHLSCLDEWLALKASCPNCRNPLMAND